LLGVSQLFIGKKVMKCNIAKELERIERKVYDLVNAQTPDERKELIKTTSEPKKLYECVLSEVSRLETSLKKRQNLGNRAKLVDTFARIICLQTLLEEYHAADKL
jgi:hypothetical protein